MKFYTVKEIADILGVSKTTVQKAIKAAAIEFDKVEKNRQYYSFEKTKQIIVKVNKDFDLGTLQVGLEVENSPTKTENQTENSQILTENSPTESENSKTQIENSPTIEKALKILEKQLDEKDNTIKDLQEKLAAAYSQISEQSKTIADLATKAQYITAADKTAQIMDRQQKQEKMKASAASDDMVQTELQKEKKWFEFWK
jgi:excisionase family DNA binding protein